MLSPSLPINVETFFTLMSANFTNESGAFPGSPRSPQWMVHYEFALLDLQLVLEAEKSKTIIT